MKATDQKREFKDRVHHWAEKLDVDVAWLGIRPMRNKWASCSTNGHLNFNTDLLPLDRELWDYVIVHELLHFFVPNHGKLWKSLMRVHLGDYERMEAKLREGRRVLR
ncbi:MAG TPA: M48 family metallopeptidase [Methylomirabilota bacterium]|nr:M48 family metallopeptidase [Methylomirabilota bacterium]